MLNLLKMLRQDEHGVILSTEIVVVGSLLVIGVITGLACLQKSVNCELQDLAGAIGALDQSYSFSAFRKSGFYGRCGAYTAGSSYRNCEYGSQNNVEIVSRSEIYPVPTVGCEFCRGGFAAGCSACGSSAGGTPVCRTAPFGTVNASRVIDTGVPNLKITEYPLSPVHENVAPAGVPGCQDCKTTESVPGAVPDHSSDGVIIIPAEQPEPVVTPAPPVHPADPAGPLVPVPEKIELPPQT